MRRWLAILIIAAVGGPVQAQSQAGTAASGPAPTKRLDLTLPKENPTVRASKQATMPGEFPSQRDNVKQIQIPLGKSANLGSTGGGIDDSVARCRAKRTSEEREACEARLDI